MTVLTFTVLWKGLTAEKGMKQLGDTTKKTSKDFAGFGKIAAAAGLVAGAALIKFSKDAVKAYSEAQQSQAKLQDAFARFPKLADTNIEALRGLNSELAKKTRFDDDATASGQAVLAQFDLTGKEITQLTPLLQDYAAKTGRDLPTAAKLLGKAVMGNGRALKEVGINFKDTGNRGKNFDQIMGGLRTQVGGFAEVEGKTAAGQLEILKNQFGELQEEAGSHLLPTLTKMVGALTGVVTAFGELSPGVKGAIGGFAVAAPTLLLAAGGITKVVSTAKAAKAALDGMTASAKKATLAASGVGIALGIAAVAFGAWAAKNAEAKEAVKSLRDELVASNGAITESIRLGKMKELQDNGQAKAAEKLGISLVLLTRAHLGDAAAIAEVNSVLDATIAAGTKHINTSRGMITTTTTHAAAAKKLQEDLAAGNITLEEAQKQARDLASANKAGGAAMEGMEKKTKDSGEELDRWRAKTLKAASAALQLEGSQDAVEAAVDDATQSVKDNGKTLDNNTEKGRNNRAALRNIASASNAYREQLDKQGASTKKVNRATDDAREAFIKVATRMGLGRKEAEKLADKYGLVKRRTDDAAKATRGYDRDINNLNSKTIKLTAQYRATATAGLVKMLKNVPGSQASGFANALGGPRRRSNIDSLVGAPTTAPTDAHGGPSFGATTTKITEPGLKRARAMGQAWDDVAWAAYRPVAKAANDSIAALGQKALQSVLAAGAPSGSVGAYSATMAGTIAALRRAGARSFTTYPGHHPSAAKARDVTPHSWKIANTARASRSVWYVIYQMKIASKNHGNTWRTYHPNNRRGDWQHRRHVHVAWYDKGGMLHSGGVAANMSGKPERVLSAAQTKSFDHLVKVISSNRGGSVGNTYIVNAPNYVGDKKDLVKALTDLDRQSRLTVVRR